jgi:hypothetical protein
VNRHLLVVGIIFLFIGVCFSSCIGVNVEQTNLPLNPWNGAWWEFNEGSGNTAYDSTGNGYDGTVFGATWTAEGLSFDGMDDYVNLDNHSVALGMNKTDDYIVQVRFKSTGSGMLYSMSHTNPERAYFDLMIDEEGKITVEMGDETCLFDLSTSGTFNDGDWHVLESEFFGDTTNPTLNLYVDGEFENTTTEWLCPMIDEDYQTAKVGRDSNDESDYFDGEIDDIKIYKSHEPPPPPLDIIITGPDSGKPGQTLTYVFTRVAWYGEDWSCFIDWGDGDSECIPAHNDAVTVSHVWDAQGAYRINAYAEADSGKVGPTATKQVTIQRNKLLNFNFNHILRILQPLSKSTEDNNKIEQMDNNKEIITWIEGINCRISFKGHGFFIFYNLEIWASSDGLFIEGLRRPFCKFNEIEVSYIYAPIFIGTLKGFQQGFAIGNIEWSK